MIQCKDCEYFEMGPDGRRTFKCEPFTNIKEPECLAKWQLIRLDMLLASYQSMLKWQKEHAVRVEKAAKMAPSELTDKILIGEFVNR